MIPPADCTETGWSIFLLPIPDNADRRRSAPGPALGSNGAAGTKASGGNALTDARRLSDGNGLRETERDAQGLG